MRHPLLQYDINTFGMNRTISIQNAGCLHHVANTNGKVAGQETGADDSDTIRPQY